MGDDRGLMLAFLQRVEAREDALELAVLIYVGDLFLSNRGEGSHQPLQSIWAYARRDALWDAEAGRCEPAVVPEQVPALVVAAEFIKTRARAVRAARQRNLARESSRRETVADLAAEAGLLVADPRDASRAPVFQHGRVSPNEWRVVDVTPPHLRGAEERPHE